MTLLAIFWTGCGFAVAGCGRLFFAFDGMLATQPCAASQTRWRTPALGQSEVIYLGSMWSNRMRTVGYDRVEAMLHRIDTVDELIDSLIGIPGVRIDDDLTVMTLERRP